MRRVSLKELKQVDKAARKLTLPPYLDPGLGALGLMIDKRPDQSRYPFATPANCQTFASTGGNGVHFSFLLLEGKDEQNAPVVVTVPAAGGLNFIVGDNLHDFLCLGYYRGYFALEQLAYNRDLTMLVYTTGDWTPTEPRHGSVGYVLSEEKRPVLDLLISRFDLRPWTDPKRFQQLQDMYLPLLSEPKGDED